MRPCANSIAASRFLTSSSVILCLTTLEAIDGAIEKLSAAKAN